LCSPSVSVSKRRVVYVVYCIVPKIPKSCDEVYIVLYRAVRRPGLSRYQSPEELKELSKIKREAERLKREEEGKEYPGSAGGLHVRADRARVESAILSAVRPYGLLSAVATSL
jgi:hypothetical protein